MERRTPSSTVIARRLRRAQTPSERAIWESVRARRFHGLKFRRQHPIDRFVADFYCNDLYLVVEIDGDVHDAAEQRRRDRARSELIERVAINLVRIPAAEALADSRAALERHIGPFLDAPPPGLARKLRRTSPSPPPPL